MYDLVSEYQQYQDATAKEVGVLMWKRVSTTPALVVEFSRTVKRAIFRLAIVEPAVQKLFVPELSGSRTASRHPREISTKWLEEGRCTPEVLYATAGVAGELGVEANEYDMQPRLLSRMIKRTILHAAILRVPSASM